MAKKLQFPKMFKRAAHYIFSEPATIMYPSVKPQISENFRGQPIFDISLCLSCGLCSIECPAQAIQMVEVEGKMRPQIRLDKCIFCSVCAETCPKHAIKTSSNFELATTDKSTLTIKPQPMTITV